MLIFYSTQVIHNINPKFDMKQLRLVSKLSKGSISI